jgi:predicted RNA-binding Zn-ribbon protein involved in translation (DUF1610 family)
MDGPISWENFAEASEKMEAEDRRNHCPKCDVLLQETNTGRRKLGDQYVCSDCYFEDLSGYVEGDPIRSPRVRRG